MERTSRTRLVGPLPVAGPWNAVGLSRGQFVGILALSLAVFLFLGGAVWTHLREPHFARITASYAVIPLLVAIAQWRRGTLRPGVFLGASALLAAMKLVVTAGFTVALGIAG